MDDLTRQIHDALERAVWALVPLLSHHIADVAGPLIASRSAGLAAQLTSGDDRIAAETVIDLAAAGIIPAEPGGAWWATPLGRAVASSVGHPSATHVSYSVAGAMLGVTRGRVGQLIAGHKLDRHPDGGVSVDSIRRRITGGCEAG